MNAAAATKAQAGLMCEIKRYGELSMDAEHAAGCHGAAFNRVLGSLERRGWITGNQTDGMALTEAGVRALAAFKAA